MNGADRTPLTIRTGVTGRLSLQVNGAHGTPVLFTRHEAEREGLWEGGIEGEGKREVERLRE